MLFSCPGQMVLPAPHSSLCQICAVLSSEVERMPLSTSQYSTLPPWQGPGYVPHILEFLIVFHASSPCSNMGLGLRHKSGLRGHKCPALSLCSSLFQASRHHHHSSFSFPQHFYLHNELPGGARSLNS